MSIAEVWIIVEAKRPKNIGKLHEDDFDHLSKRREQLESEGVKVL